MGEHDARLEQGEVALAALHVAPQHAEEPRQQARAQVGGVGGDGVAEADPLVVVADELGVCAANDRRGPRLERAESDHRLAHAPPHLHGRRQRPGGRPRRDPRRQRGVAVEPGHLLGDVGDPEGRGPHVGAPRRCRDLEGVALLAHREADRTRQPGDLVRATARRRGWPRGCAASTRTTAGSVSWPRTSSGSPRTLRPGELCASSSTTRRAATSQREWSQPRSKRADASVRSRWRFALRATAIGSNHADSSTTVVVASLISVDAPPMIPASPIATSSPSQMTRSSPVSPSAPDARPSSRTVPSSSSSRSPSAARRTRSVRRARRSRS